MVEMVLPKKYMAILQKLLSMSGKGVIGRARGAESFNRLQLTEKRGIIYTSYFLKYGGKP